MPLRIVVGIVASAAAAGFLVGAFGPRVTAPVAGAAPAHVAPPATPPQPPAHPPDAARPRVPAGILSRAASARALERGGACAPPVPNEPSRCAAEARESIEIEWHVSRDP